MQWQIIVALIVAIPVILLPVVFVWYLNVAGLREARRSRQAAAKKARVTVETDSQ